MYVYPPWVPRCVGLYSKECNHWSFLFSHHCNATSCFMRYRKRKRTRLSVNRYLHLHIASTMRVYCMSFRLHSSYNTYKSNKFQSITRVRWNKSFKLSNWKIPFIIEASNGYEKSDRLKIWKLNNYQNTHRVLTIIIFDYESIRIIFLLYIVIIIMIMTLYQI